MFQGSLLSRGNLELLLLLLLLRPLVPNDALLRQRFDGRGGTEGGRGREKRRRVGDCGGVRLERGERGRMGERVADDRCVVRRVEVRVGTGGEVGEVRVHGVQQAGVIGGEFFGDVLFVLGQVDGCYGGW